MSPTLVIDARGQIPPQKHTQRTCTDTRARARAYSCRCVPRPPQCASLGLSGRRTWGDRAGETPADFGTARCPRGSSATKRARNRVPRGSGVGMRPLSDECAGGLVSLGGQKSGDGERGRRTWMREDGWWWCWAWLCAHVQDLASTQPDTRGSSLDSGPNELADFRPGLDQELGNCGQIVRGKCGVVSAISVLGSYTLGASTKYAVLRICLGLPSSRTP